MSLPVSRVLKHHGWHLVGEEARAAVGWPGPRPLPSCKAHLDSSVNTKA